MHKANAYIWGCHEGDGKKREHEEADEWDSSHAFLLYGKCIRKVLRRQKKPERTNFADWVKVLDTPHGLL